MLASERQRQIQMLIEKNGAGTTAEIAKILDVSIETIRKDFLIMEKADKISRVYGGAIAKVKLSPPYELTKRFEENINQKRELSLNAIEFISEGDIIGIDEGSTASIFAEVLKENFSRLTVITYSADVFNILHDHENFSLILCGGQYKKSERVFFGLQTLESLSNLHIQKAFVFPAAISLNHGIGGYQDDLLQLQKQLMKSASQIYILADSSKFEKKALLKLSDMDEKYNYITDNQLNLELQKIYKENNIRIFS